MHALRKMHNNHILGESHDDAVDGMGMCRYLRLLQRYSVSHVKVHDSLHCPYHVYGCCCLWNWMLLWLPSKIEVGPLWLQKNKMKTDIKFSARHVCKSQDSWEKRPLDSITVQRTQKLLTDLRHISLFVTFRNVLICAKFMATQWNNTLVYPCHSLILPESLQCNTQHVHKEAQYPNIWKAKLMITLVLTSPLRKKKNNSRQEKNKLLNFTFKFI